MDRTRYLSELHGLKSSVEHYRIQCIDSAERIKQVTTVDRPHFSSYVQRTMQSVIIMNYVYYYMKCYMDILISCVLHYVSYAAIVCQVGVAADYSSELSTSLWADATAMKDFKGPISRAAEALRLGSEPSELHQARAEQLKDNCAKANQTTTTMDSSSSMSDQLRDAPSKAERDETLKEELRGINTVFLQGLDNFNNNCLATVTTEEKEQHEKAWSYSAMRVRWSSVSPTTGIAEFFF